MGAQARESLEERLYDFLESLDYAEQDTHVESTSPRNVIGIVTTPEFEGVDEAERQSEVWGALQETFSSEERARIEFVFTNTPEEEADMEEEDE